MGAQQSNTSLRNEYQEAYNQAIGLINQRLPYVERKIQNCIDYFKEFEALDVNSIQDVFIFLDAQKPIPFTKNVYKNKRIKTQQSLNQSKNLTDILNNSEFDSDVKNNKVLNPNEYYDYANLLKWGQSMHKTFLNMKQIIDDKSIKIRKIYQNIFKDTFPSVKNIIHIYSDYITKCFLFATYNDDLYGLPYILDKWKVKENNFVTNFEQLYDIISKSSPEQVMLRNDQPIVIKEELPAPIVIQMAQPAPAPAPAPAPVSVKSVTSNVVQKTNSQTVSSPPQTVSSPPQTVSSPPQTVSSPPQSNHSKSFDTMSNNAPEKRNEKKNQRKKGKLSTSKKVFSL
jgi:hypothetical protein